MLGRGNRATVGKDESEIEKTQYQRRVIGGEQAPRGVVLPEAIEGVVVHVAFRVSRVPA